MVLGVSLSGCVAYACTLEANNWILLALAALALARSPGFLHP